MTSDRPVRVLVIGGGIAAFELVLALRAHADEDLRITMVAPGDALLYRPEAVFEPFSFATRRYDLVELTDALHVELVRGRVGAVEAGRRVVHVDGERTLTYDELVVAAGAAAAPAVQHATTLRAEDADALHWLVRELEDGSAQHVVLVAGPGSGWTLPAYELAFLLQERASGMGVEHAVSVVTHERTPLEVFEGPGTAEVARLLSEADIRVICRQDRVRRIPHALVLERTGEQLPADRVLALPALRGPGIRGLLLDAAGFVRVGPHLEVPGIRGVHVVGDAASLPVKQGGLAAQHADVVATDLLARAGIVDPVQHRHAPQLRASLVTGERTGDRLYLAGPLIGDRVVAPEVGRTRPDWATQKIAATHLGPFLAAVDRDGARSAAAAVHGRGAHSGPGR